MRRTLKSERVIRCGVFSDSARSARPEYFRRMGWIVFPVFRAAVLYFAILSAERLFKDQYFMVEFLDIVSYIPANAEACRCPECPVQAESQCAAQGMKNIKKAMGGKCCPRTPDRQSFPGLYCSKGKAGCHDIDTRRLCICDTCNVWKENGLMRAETTDHFCRNGKAQRMMC